MNRPMWDRPALKDYAKAALRNFYWKAVIASLIVSVLCGGFASNSGVKFEYNFDQGFQTHFNFHGLENYINIAALTVFLLFFGLIAMVIGALYSAFIANPLEVGQHRFYLESRFNSTDIGRVFSGFTGGNYSNIAKTLFIRDLKVFLWSLLFVIPGIIKAYEYSMVPYILAENPNISTERAFQLSRDMTLGRKWDLFVFDLSFFGWNILASALVIGHIFLRPYVQASKAELYLWLRYDALCYGYAQDWELNGLFMERPEYTQY